jgi:hypothetical protein
MNKIKSWMTANYPFIVVSVVPLILFLEPLLTGKVIFWGTPMLQFIPWQSYAFESVRHGILPLWNPLNGMGAPLLANYQLAFFYPTNWLIFLLYIAGSAAWLAWGQTAMILVHLIWAAVGMVMLARQLDFDKPAQVIAGLSFGMGGYLFARTSFYPMIWAASWLPWIIYAGSRIAAPISSSAPSGPIRFKDILLLTIFIALQLLAGHAQICWYTLLLLVTWVLFGSLTTRKLTCVLRNVGVVLACILAAAALAAVQLVPTFEYLLQSQRAIAVDRTIALNYSFWPWHLFTLASSKMFGSPASGIVWGSGNFWEDAIYMGVLPFLMAIGTAATGLKKKVKDPVKDRYRPLAIFCWTVSIISIFLALGRNSPLFMFFYNYVPTFKSFQAPARFLLWFAFCFSILAGMGIHLRKMPRGKNLYVLRLTTMAAFAVALAGGLAYLLLPGVKPTVFLGLMWFGFWASCTGLLLLFQLQKKSLLWTILLIAIAAIDLGITWWKVIPTTQMTLFQSTSVQTNPASGGRIFLSDKDGNEMTYQRFFRFTDFRSTEDWANVFKVYLPDTNLLSGVASVNNFDPILPQCYQVWMDTLSKVPEDKLSTWLAFMGVNVWEQVDPTAEEGVRFTSIEGSARARFYTCSVNARDQSASLELMEAMLNGSNPPLANKIILEKEGGGEAGNPCIEPIRISTKDVSDEGNQLTVHLIASGNGFLLLSDTWYPGWKVEVDGKSELLLKADYLFKAVALDSGEHTVVFTYKPISFFIGLTISICSFSCIIIGSILTILVRRRYHGKS